MARVQRPLAPATLVLDAQGLTLAAGADPLVRAHLQAAVTRAGSDVVVSAVTLTETLRGGPRDVRLYRVLAGIRVVEVTEELARAAGELLGRGGPTGATIDAIVVATALAQPGQVRILTSDPGDIGKLVGGERRVTVVAV